MEVVIKIAIGADHAGLTFKRELAKILADMGHEVLDHGTHSLDSVDYPDFAKTVSRSVADKEVDAGVLICGTGIGMSITANRTKGVRAALCWSTDAAELARSHNNANILCLGARTQSLMDCIRIMKVFFKTDFSSGERHARRVDKMG